MTVAKESPEVWRQNDSNPNFDVKYFFFWGGGSVNPQMNQIFHKEKVCVSAVPEGQQFGVSVCFL